MQSKLFITLYVSAMLCLQAVSATAPLERDVSSSVNTPTKVRDYNDLSLKVAVPEKERLEAESQSRVKGSEFDDILKDITMKKRNGYPETVTRKLKLKAAQPEQGLNMDKYKTVYPENTLIKSVHEDSDYPASVTKPVFKKEYGNSVDIRRISAREIVGRPRQVIPDVYSDYFEGRGVYEGDYIIKTAPFAEEQAEAIEKTPTPIARKGSVYAAPKDIGEDWLYSRRISTRAGRRRGGRYKATDRRPRQAILDVHRDSIEGRGVYEGDYIIKTAPYAEEQAEAIERTPAQIAKKGPVYAAPKDIGEDWLYSRRISTRAGRRRGGGYKATDRRPRQVYLTDYETRDAKKIIPFDGLEY